MQQVITKKRAAFGEIILEGISRMAVLGFFLSKCLSMYRLKAIAALRAKSIHKITRINFSQLNETVLVLIAREKPIKQKGKAKIV